MINPDLKIRKYIDNIHPDVGRWVYDWYMRELKMLPKAGQDSVQAAQGRCQVLAELTELMNKSNATRTD